MYVEATPARLFLRITLVALAGLLGWLNGLGRADQLIYDHALTLFERPAPQDVLIVTIDDKSIDSLGRWPWPRSLHSVLLEHLKDAQAVGLNVVFSETDAHRAKEDQLLAEAIRKHGRVVLPIVLNKEQYATVADLPIAPLASAAAGLGYINVDLDDDGVLRRTTWSNGTDNHPWHQFVLAMLEVGGDATKVDNFLQQLSPNTKTLIPYAGKPGHFKTVSYLDVLKGIVPAEAIKNKYVLVGAWATGLGDTFPSPVSHHANGISGIEVLANLLHAARKHTIIVTASAWQTALASALAVLLLCLVLPKLSPRQAMLYTLSLLALTLSSAVLIMYIGGVWVPPGAALFGIAISYPIWSWRSQEAALRYMSREMEQLRIEYPPLLDNGKPPPKKGLARSLDQQIEELNHTLTYTRDLRRFISDALDGIPDATIVIDTAGRIRYRNQPAIAYFLHLGIRPPRVGQHFIQALELAFPSAAARDAIRQVLQTHEQDVPTRNANHATQTDTSHLSVEVRDRADHDLLFRSSHIRTTTGAYAGSVLKISDISTLRQAERQREQTLQFISHDMRSPQNSILALIERHRQENSNDEALCHALTRIEHFANRTLYLVDDFIQLTRAESMRIAHDQMDLVAIVHELADDFWATTQPRGITLHVQSSTPIALACGDTSLIRRALSNLIENAIKYGPNNSTIYIRLAEKSGAWNIDVEDKGHGISTEEQRCLFEPFFRTKMVRESQTEGSGLGLAFVLTVAQRHSGAVSVHSEVGVGSRFTFSLPLMAEDSEV